MLEVPNEKERVLAGPLFIERSRFETHIIPLCRECKFLRRRVDSMPIRKNPDQFAQMRFDKLM